MIGRLPYDLLVILAGDKADRHTAAVKLMCRGWARYLTVTGEYEQIDPHPALEGRILPAPASTSTYEDALAVRTLIRRHQLDSVLVVTSGSQANRAKLVFGRVFADLPTTIDLLTWEPATGWAHRPTRPLRVVRTQFAEVIKLVYYLVRRRA